MDVSDRDSGGSGDLDGSSGGSNADGGSSNSGSNDGTGGSIGGSNGTNGGSNMAAQRGDEPDLAILVGPTDPRAEAAPTISAVTAISIPVAQMARMTAVPVTATVTNRVMAVDTATPATSQRAAVLTTDVGWTTDAAIHRGTLMAAKRRRTGPQRARVRSMDGDQRKVATVRTAMAADSAAQTAVHAVAWQAAMVHTMDADATKARTATIRSAMAADRVTQTATHAVARQTAMVRTMDADPTKGHRAATCMVMVERSAAATAMLIIARGAPAGNRINDRRARHTAAVLAGLVYP
jgi:hypothetical protein